MPDAVTRDWDRPPEIVADELIRELREEEARRMAERQGIPRDDLHPKIRAQAKLGGVLAVAVIVAGVIPQIAGELGITLPTIVGTLLTIVLLIGRGYQKAGDGR